MVLESSKSTCRSFLPLVLGSFAIFIFFFIKAIGAREDLFIFLGGGLFLLICYLIRLRHNLCVTKSQISLNIQKYREEINLLEFDIKRQHQAIQSLQEKLLSYQKLKGVTERLSLCLHPEETTAILSKELDRLLDDDQTTVILYLFHSKTGELGISSSKKGQMRVNIKSKKGDIFDRWVIKGMRALLVKDIYTDYRFDVSKVMQGQDRLIRSLMSVPLMVGHKALGILRVDSPREGRFSLEDLRFLTTIGDLGALAIENAQLYERVERLAVKDGLTGLYLKTYFLERMDVEIKRHLRNNNTVSFLMIDIDKFKEYNDKYGHVAGDIVLRTVGSILSNFFKEPGDMVCRYGGEEFSVLLPDCSKVQALARAQQVRKKIETKNVVLRRRKTRVTVSIGVAVYPWDGRDKEDLIHKADMALYQAKNKGRNRVEQAS